MNKGTGLIEINADWYKWLTDELATAIDGGNTFADISRMATELAKVNHGIAKGTHTLV